MGKQKPKPPSIKGSRKVDWTLVIAGLALFVSLAQLIVTIPLISQKLFAPELLVTTRKVEGNAASVVGSFEVENRGSTAATNVEVGFVAVVGDELHVFPSGAHDVVNKNPDQALFIHRTLNFDRILPGEKFSVIVSSLRRDEKDTQAAVRMMKATGVKNMPNIIFVRSAEGRGVIEESKDEPLKPDARTI